MPRLAPVTTATGADMPAADHTARAAVKGAPAAAGYTSSA